MEFKFIDLVKYYLKNLLSNIIVFLVVFLLGLIYIFNIHKTEYVANTTFMIGACFHNCEQEAHLNVDFNKKVLFDYMELIRSVPVLEKANQKSNLKYSTQELKSMVSTSYVEDTEYVKITVVSSDKKDCADIAYNIFDALVSEIERIFDVNNIHMVESDLVGYEKTSKKRLIIYNFIIALIITIIKTIIQFLFFSQNNKKLEGTSINSNNNESKVVAKVKRKKGKTGTKTAKGKTAPVKKTTSTKAAKGKTAPAKKTTSTKVAKGKTAPAKKTTSTKVAKGKTAPAKKTTSTKAAKRKTVLAKKTTSTKTVKGKK